MIPTIDHTKLIERDKEEVAKLVELLKTAAVTTGFLGVSVKHEADDSCCKREFWATTLCWVVDQADIDLPVLPSLVDFRAPGKTPLEDPAQAPPLQRERTEEQVHHCKLIGFATTVEQSDSQKLFVLKLEPDMGTAWNVGLCRKCAEILHESLAKALRESPGRN